jgi:hypothetical protein
MKNTGIYGDAEGGTTTTIGRGKNKPASTDSQEDILKGEDVYVTKTVEVSHY